MAIMEEKEENMIKGKISFRESRIPGVGRARVEDPSPGHAALHELYEEAGYWLGPPDQVLDAVEILRRREHVWLDSRGFRQGTDPPQRSGWLVIVRDVDDIEDLPLQEQFEEPVWLSFRGAGPNAQWNYADYFLRNQNHNRPPGARGPAGPRIDQADMLLKVDAHLDHEHGLVHWDGFVRHPHRNG